MTRSSYLIELKLNKHENTLFVVENNALTRKVVVKESTSIYK